MENTETGLVFITADFIPESKIFTCVSVRISKYKYLHQVHDKSVHTNVAQSSSEEHRLQLLLVNLEHARQGQQKPPEPHLAAGVLLVVLSTAVLLQHQVGLVLQDLNLQRMTEPVGVRVEEDESLETSELCVVQGQLRDPVDSLAELSVGAVGGE